MFLRRTRSLPKFRLILWSHILVMMTMVMLIIIVVVVVVVIVVIWIHSAHLLENLSEANRLSCLVEEI